MTPAKDEPGRDPATPFLEVRERAPDWVEVDTARVNLLRAEDGSVLLFALELESDALVEPIPADFKEVGSTAFIRWGIPAIKPVSEPGGDAGIRWDHVHVVAEELAHLDEECRQSHGIGFPAYPGVEGFTRSPAEDEVRLRILNWGMTPKSPEHVPEADPCAVAVASLARWLTRRSGPVRLRRKDQQHLEHVERMVLAGSLQLPKLREHLRDIRPVKRWVPAFDTLPGTRSAWAAAAAVLALILVVTMVRSCDDEPRKVRLAEAINSQEPRPSRLRSGEEGKDPKDNDGPIERPPERGLQGECGHGGAGENPDDQDPVKPPDEGGPNSGVDIPAEGELERTEPRQFLIAVQYDGDKHAEAIASICDLAEVYGRELDPDVRKQIIQEMDQKIRECLGAVWGEPGVLEEDGDSEAEERARWIGPATTQIRLIRYLDAKERTIGYRLWWKKEGKIVPEDPR